MPPVYNLALPISYDLTIQGGNLVSKLPFSPPNTLTFSINVCDQFYFSFMMSIKKKSRNCESNICILGEGKLSYHHPLWVGLLRLSPLGLGLLGFLLRNH
jgi:hypothetical protein